MQIYISHSPQDRDVAKTLAAQLEHAGFSVWDEDRAIFPGDNWAKKVGEALESSEVLVALIAHHDRDMEALARDVQYALTQGERYFGRVVPVLVGVQDAELGDEVPWILRKLSPIYIASPEQGFDQVVSRIQTLGDAACHATR
jgi:hypothetical protein